MNDAMIETLKLDDRYVWEDLTLGGAATCEEMKRLGLVGEPIQAYDTRAYPITELGRSVKK